MNWSRWSISSRERAEAVAAESGSLALTDYRQILDQVDLVTIAVPTRCHFAIAHDFLAAGRHVLLEKPLTEKVIEADALISLAAINNVVFHVGYLERFNPAIMAMQGVVKDPRIVFSHRLAHQYTILTAERESLQKRLSAAVASAVYYSIPLHRQEVYREMFADIVLPQAEQTACQVLSLPMYPELTEMQIERICTVLLAACEN